MLIKLTFFLILIKASTEFDGYIIQAEKSYAVYRGSRWKTTLLLKLYSNGVEADTTFLF